MALTLTTEPSDIVSAYRPVEWEVTTDRDGGGEHTVSSISSGTGAFARYTHVSITHNFIVGDIITGSDFTDALYNVRQTVTVIIDSTTYETDVAFVATDAGTMTKTNDRFKVKADVLAIGSEPVKTILQVSASTGKIRIDITDHGYSVGDYVLIAGTTSYDGYIVVYDVPSTISFVVDLSFVADEAGTVQKLSIIGSKSQQAISVSGVDTYRFDVSNYLQSIVSFDLPVLTGNNLSSPNTGSIIVYIVKFTEQYDDLDGLLQDKDTVVSSLGDKYATNTTLQHLETQSLTAFTVDSNVKRFLTNIPTEYSVGRHQVVGRNEYLNLAFLTNEPTIKFTQFGYDASGSTTETFTSVLKTIVDKRGTLRISVSSFLATTVSFTVVLKNSASGQRSEVLKFLIDDKCYDQSTRVWFLNRLGGMDSFTLTGDIKERIKSRITSYDRRVGSGFAVTDRGTTALGIRSSELFEVHSDFLTVAQRTWLSELLTSPVVFLQEDTVLIPVINLSKTVTRRQGDDLSQIKLSYTLSNNPILQTG